MSLLTTHAKRETVDLSRFVFNLGQIGCLKVLDSTLVQAGDSYSADMVGSFSLSPMRRGLSLDTKLDIFTFYCPLRYVEPTFVDLLTAGPGSGITLPPVDTGGIDASYANYLGTRPNVNFQVPGYLHKTYVKIYNNYFKDPTDIDLNMDPTTWPTSYLETGVPACHLKSWTTSPLSNEYADTADVAISGSTFALRDLTHAAATLHADQERALFAKRYRDLVDMFGGRGTPEVDQRPELIQRTEMWASGFDVDGTTDTSMGSFSGRVRQSFSHKVPRYYCREHGVMMTVALPRFPPVHHYSIPYLSGRCANLDYETLVHDPVIAGVEGLKEVAFSEMFDGGSDTAFIHHPFQQHFRVAEPDHVDSRYASLQGFPFLSHAPQTQSELVYVYPADYDDMFHSDALLHWQMQLKTNVKCLRYMVTARDTLTNDN